MLGISLAGRSEAEINFLLVLKPKLEAYYEYLHRRSDSEWTEERARQIILTVSDDEAQAESAANAVKFSKTPLQ